jgi:hypothetical protein
MFLQSKVVSLASNIQPREPGLCIYVPQWQGGRSISTGIGFPFSAPSTTRRATVEILLTPSTLERPLPSVGPKILFAVTNYRFLISMTGFPLMQVYIFFLLLLFINCNWAYARWQCLQKGYTVNKEHSTPMSRKDDTYISRFVIEKSEGKRLFPRPRNRWKILKCISKKWDMRVWTEFFWLRVGSLGGV